MTTAGFAGLSTATYGTGTHTVTVAPPPLATTGDTLFLTMTGFFTGTPADPSGWTQRHLGNSILASDYWSGVWEAPFGTSLSVSWTVPSGANGMSVGLWAWRGGVFQSVTANYDSASPNGQESHGTNVAGADAVWFGQWGWMYPGTTTVSDLEGWTERAATQSSTIYGETAEFVSAPAVPPSVSGPSWTYSNTAWQLRTRVKLLNSLGPDVVAHGGIYVDGAVHF